MGVRQIERDLIWDFLVEAMGLEPTNLLTASQALYQLSYAPGQGNDISLDTGIQRAGGPGGSRSNGTRHVRDRRGSDVRTDQFEYVGANATWAAGRAGSRGVQGCLAPASDPGCQGHGPCSVNSPDGACL